jgi:hypothetical protein
MSSSVMLRRVVLVRTDVSEELSAPLIRVTKIGELGTTLAVTSNRHTLLVFLRSVRLLLVTANVPSSPILVTLMKEALSPSTTSAPTRATRRNTPEDGLLYKFQLRCCYHKQLAHRNQTDHKQTAPNGTETSLSWMRAAFPLFRLVRKVTRRQAQHLPFLEAFSLFLFIISLRFV